MTGAGLDLDEDDPLASALTTALRSGDVEAVARLLGDHPGLARRRIVSRRAGGGSRTPLHVFADWPGHNPRPREVVALLQGAGADLDAAFVGTSPETALHWAASSDDLELIEALLDAGADIEARGAVIAGGTALADATAFGQWRAAELLLRRGARANLFEAAVMGLVDVVEAALASSGGPDPEAVTHAFWGACHGGRQKTAALLLARGADIDWVGWDGLTPRDAAQRTGDSALVEWIEANGGRWAADPAPGQVDRS